MSKEVYIIFHAQLVDTTIYVYQGNKQFHNEDSQFGSRRNKRKGISTCINFGKCMKH